MATSETEECAVRPRRSAKRRAYREARALIGKSGNWQPEHDGHLIEPLNAEQVEAIHDASMRMLEEVGMEILHDGVLAMLEDAGAIVDRTARRVRVGREIVEEAVRLAPSSFTIEALNKARDITIGENRVTFLPVGSAPNASDMDGGRRTGNRRDFRNFVRLSYQFDCIHSMGGYPCEPVDLHPSVRHLEALHDKLTLSDKVPHIYSLGKERVEDSLEMVRIAHGLSQDDFLKKPRLYTNINTNSPMKLDHPMIDGAMRCARKGQAVFVTPFTLAGAMAPITLAGAVAQQNAEALCGLAILQLAAPGAKVVYGGFTSNTDMRSGAPAFGTPEHMRAMQMSGQMARRYGLPYRAASANASNAPDAQSVWESVFSLWGAITGGANVIYHAAGWLEGGLTASYEKFIIDCELLEWIATYLKPLPLDESDLGLDAVAEVGPGGHFFGCAHTQARYQAAFHHPFLSDWRNFETWFEDGGKDATQRANALWKQALADYAPPECLSQERLEALSDFVARRTEEGGAPTDF